MKTINCWDDLNRYGIVPLTGEACGLMYRILCDVTARGKRTLEKALGVTELRLPENWNQGDTDSPHIGSVMLARELLPFVGVFALLESGCTEVWLTKAGGLIGVERNDAPDDLECFKRFHANDLARRFAYSGTAGDRNQHMMSGRVQ
ncbi:MAG: hypothetical protein ACYC0X_15370 [Pirellulaceae bacterium]